jgi:hypothetical protein
MIAQGLGYHPLWVYNRLTAESRYTVNWPLLHEIARQKGYNKNWPYVMAQKIKARRTA